MPREQQPAPTRTVTVAVRDVQQFMNWSVNEPDSAPRELDFLAGPDLPFYVREGTPYCIFQVEIIHYTPRMRQVRFDGTVVWVIDGEFAHLPASLDIGGVSVTPELTGTLIYQLPL